MLHYLLSVQSGRGLGGGGTISEMGVDMTCKCVSMVAGIFVNYFGVFAPLIELN